MEISLLHFQQDLLVILLGFVSSNIFIRGTFTWGSRSSVAGSNVWGSTMSSPNTDGSTGSPSYVNGSYTRPSTATSDKSYHTTTGAWAPNSRPSSSSGILPDHPTVVATRPRSAETTHGGPHQSYIGESSPEPSAWGPSRTHEKLVLFFSLPYQIGSY